MPEDFLLPERRPLTRLFPALRLVGAIRQAFDFRKLIIAVLGLAVLQGGWVALDRLVGPSDDTMRNVFGSAVAPKGFYEPDFWSWETVSALSMRVSEPSRLLVTPLLRFVDPGAGRGRMLHAILSVIWLIAVWGICGGAISRIAVVQVAAMRQTGSIAALRFALAHAHPLIVAPLCPLGAIVFLSLFSGLFGLLYRVPAVGPVLAGIGLILPLMIGLLMTLFIAAMVAGWPLLQAATAAGAEDALDAVSRIFGYLNQRLGWYVAFVALAWLCGLIGLALIDVLTAGVIRLTFWSLALTAPIAVTEPFFVASTTSASASAIASAAHNFWLGTVRLIAHAWVFSFFWTAAAHLYLWLRHDVDGAPWTEIEPVRVPSHPPRV